MFCGRFEDHLPAGRRTRFFVLDLGAMESADIVEGAAFAG